LPSGEHSMGGSFNLTPDAMTLSGSVTERDIVWTVTGSVSADATSVGVVPPQQLLDRISGDVNAELDESIADAEKAWQDLKDATADYEFELSLRGIRSALPGAVDTAKKALSDGIAAELKKHEGKAYYSSLKSHLRSADDKYFTALNNLKSLAQSTTDSDAWRSGIEAALRKAAGYKYFETTYKYKVAGVTVKTVNVKKRILSDTQVSQLTTAANNVKYIEETSARKITAQQIYDAIPDKEIFERVKDDIQNGLVVIPGIGELGFVFRHDGSKTLDVYAIIAGERNELGSVDVFSIDDMAAALADMMVDVLIAD
jgi:hypothetical protein